MKRLKRTLALALASLMLLTVCAAAAGTQQAITVDTGTTLQVDGKDFKPQDANGKSVPIFNYEGTTYAPVRALAEAFGLQVGWDQAKGQATVAKGAASAPAAAAMSVPDPRIICVYRNLPKPEGDPDSAYFDLHWAGYPEEAKLTCKVVKGALPDGITLSKEGILDGPVKKLADTVVTVEISDGKDLKEERDIHFRFRARGVPNAKPVVIVGIAGQYREEYLDLGAHNMVDLDDTLHTIPDFQDLGAKEPIGTQKGLDALAAYGFTLREEAKLNHDDNDYVYCDFILSGTPAKGTNGWVKIEIPAYFAYSMGIYQEDGKTPERLLSVIPSQNNALSVGNIEVYLNIIAFD